MNLKMKKENVLLVSDSITEMSTSPYKWGGGRLNKLSHSVTISLSFVERSNHTKHEHVTVMTRLSQKMCQTSSIMLTWYFTSYHNKT